MKRSTVLACIAAATFVSVEAAADERYFGLEVPRQRPEVFEPAVIAAILPLVATNPAFSGDFRRFAFTAVDASTPSRVAIRVYEARFDGKRWSRAKPLQLLADRTANSGEPMFSPDGQWLYFTSNGLPGASYSDTRAYRARLTGAGYEPAQRVPLDIPPTQRVFYPQPLADGSMLLTSRVANSTSRDDVFIAARAGGAVCDSRCVARRLQFRGGRLGRHRASTRAPAPVGVRATRRRRPHRYLLCPQRRAESVVVGAESVSREYAVARNGAAVEPRRSRVVLSACRRPA